MKIAVAEFPMYIGHPIEEMVAEVAEIGYEHIELAAAPRVAEGAGEGVVGSLARALESHSVGLAAVGVGIAVPLASTDQEVRRAAVQGFAGTVRMARRLGCALVTSEMSGGNSLTRAECVAAFERSVSELVPILEAEGVDVAFEPHPGDFVESHELGLEILNRIGHERVGYLYCCPHTFLLGGDPASMIASAGGLLKFVHVADSNSPEKIVVGYAPKGYANALHAEEFKGAMNAHEHLVPGKGDVDFGAVFAALGAIGYEGYVSAIPFGIDRPRSTAQAALAAIRAYLGPPGPSIPLPRQRRSAPDDQQQCDQDGGCGEPPLRGPGALREPARRGPPG